MTVKITIVRVTRTELELPWWQIPKFIFTNNDENEGDKYTEWIQSISNHKSASTRTSTEVKLTS